MQLIRSSRLGSLQSSVRNSYFAVEIQNPSSNLQIPNSKLQVALPYTPRLNDSTKSESKTDPFDELPQILKA